MLDEKEGQARAGKSKKPKKKENIKRNRPTGLAVGPSSAGLVDAWAISLFFLWAVNLQKG